MFPDWVQKHKKQGYEIKKIRSKFYMYQRKSRWDSEKKKSVKVTGNYIGVVTPEGVLPKKEIFDAAKPIFTLEYGASLFVKIIAGDLLETLQKHFEKDIATRIWVIAMLRLISPCPFNRIEEHYQTSWLSILFPKLALSKSAITNLITFVGNNRVKCAAFMRDTMQSAPYLLIDGSRVSTKSEGIFRAMAGHNSDQKFIPQINQIHIVTVSESGDSMPGFYRNVAGNIPDVTAFELTLEDAEVDGGIVVADCGFSSSNNFDLIEQSNLKYIAPLKRNTSEVNLSAVEFSECFSYHNRGIQAHTEKKDDYKICIFRDVYKYAQEFSTTVCRIEKENATILAKKKHDITELNDVHKQTKSQEDDFGIIVLRTNILDKSAAYIFQTYKIRWDIELLLKTLRNTCDQDASYMHNDAGFEAWTFLGHLTMIAACRILAKLREKDLLKNWSLEGLLDHLSRIQTIQISNNWRLAEQTKKTKALLKALNFTLLPPKT